jgi:hypothetical protein
MHQGSNNMRSATPIKDISQSFVFFALALSAVLIAGFAQADTIIYSDANFDITASTPIDVGTTPRKAVILTATGHNGYKPKGFDSTKSDYGSDGTGITTTDDELYQVPFYGLNTPTNSPNLNPTLDTHFLINPNTYISISDPAETMNVANASDDPNGYCGDSLTGNFFLKDLPASSTWDFARLVVPNNTVVHFDFEILGALDLESSISAEVVGSMIVPEPSCIILLCACGFSMLVYLSRRRKVA